VPEHEADRVVVVVHEARGDTVVRPVGITGGEGVVDGLGGRAEVAVGVALVGAGGVRDGLHLAAADAPVVAGPAGCPPGQVVEVGLEERLGACRERQGGQQESDDPRVRAHERPPIRPSVQGG
jgi:hypothetical protein